MTYFLQQIKNRRLALQLKQSDMFMRTGISRQQYQRIESKGNPRLDTLELIAKGLNSELLLVPAEQISQVKAILNAAHRADSTEDDDLIDNPWRDIFRDNE
ncbi:MAG: transcriptional regulator [Deltaproteobacteria bacterium]|nr:MAG: transcriptional regulator [Deltaproteobacteria bacterium]